MEMLKSDWTIIREAEEQGLMVAMTSLNERNRTELNIELSNYFNKKLPNYESSFDENEAEEILYRINEYLVESKSDKPSLEFPISGTELYLIPINENIQLKVVVVDEYHGDGEYSKYVMIDFFLITDSASKQDVDVLLKFINEFLY